MRDRIFHEDCVGGMKKLPGKSVQLVVTSPPYNVRKPYNKYKDNLEYEQYLKFMRDVFSECFRVLKDSGVCFVNIANCAKNQFKAFDLAFLMRDLGFTLLDTIIWDKPNPRYLNTQRLLTNAYEFVFMFVKSKKYVFNKLAIGLPCRTQPGLKCRTNVWHIEKVYKNQFVGWKHCAMFPEELPKLCIKLCSNPGDLVLDPFMGAGTTAVAAKKLDRNFVGFEISREYVQMSLERLDEIKRVEVKDEQTSTGPFVAGLGVALCDRPGI